MAEVSRQKDNKENNPRKQQKQKEYVSDELIGKLEMLMV